MVPCHSCHIYEIWRNKEVGDTLRSSFGMAAQVPNREWEFLLEGDFSLCNTAVLKIYCKSYWGP